MQITDENKNEGKHENLYFWTRYNFLLVKWVQCVIVSLKFDNIVLIFIYF